MTQDFFFLNISPAETTAAKCLLCCFPAALPCPTMGYLAHPFCPWHVLQSTGAMKLMELFGCVSLPHVGQTLSYKTWASYIGMQVREESPESLWTILCYSLFGFLSSFYLYFLIPTCVWYGSWILRIPDA